MSSLTVPFRPSDISTGLVGYWKFNNNANDSSASAYHLKGAPEINVSTGLETWTGLTNLVTNGDMETGSPPSTWILLGAGATWARESTTIKTGTYSGKLTRSGTDTQVYQNVGGAGLIGKTIVVRAWVWCDVANKAAVWVGDGGGGGTSYWDYHPGDSQWHYMTGYIVVGASTTAVYAYCHIDTTDCSAYFDDFICYEQLAPTSWTYYAPSGGIVYQEIEFVKAGTYSAKATAPAGYTTQLYQMIASPGSYSSKTMIFSAWCKSSEASTARLMIYTAGATSSYAYSSYHTGSGNWELLSVTLTLPASCTDFWTLMNLTGDAGGATCYWDETNCYESTYTQTDYWKSGEYSGTSASGKYWTITDQATLDLAISAFTICGWFKATDITTVTIVDKGSGATGYAVQIDSSSKLVLNMNNGARATSVTAVVAGKWYFFATRYDGATAQIYLDGNLDISSAYSTNCTSTATGFFVGVEDDTSTAPFLGQLKDIAIWTSALTPIQIKSLALGVDLSKYAYRPSNVSTQPTHWWKLNEVSGNRADSVSTNPLTLTDNNTVLSSGGYVEGVGADFERANSEFFSAVDSADWDLGSGNFTMRARLKYESFADGDYQIILDNDGGTENNFSWWFMTYRSGSTYYIAFQYSTSGASGTIASKSVTWAPILGVWYDVVVRRNGNDLSFAVDGLQVGATQDVTGVTIYNNTMKLKIGCSGLDSSEVNFFDGQIEDLAIWKGYALTDAEIKSLACALPIQRAGIVMYSKMNAASGNETSEIGSLTLVDTNTVGTGTGKVGDARDFEATNSEFFEIANVDAIDIVSDMAIFGWHKPEAIDITQTLVDKDYAGDGYGIRIGTDEKINFYISNDTDVSSSSVVAGTFVHFFGNYDGANKAMWINGVLEGNGAFTTNPADTTTALRIGSTIAGGDYMDGLADEFGLTNRYFRPEEIKAVYLKGLNGKEATSSEISLSSILKVAGVVYASIKTISGLAIASIKKVAGLA